MTSVLHVAAMFRARQAKARFKDKKVVKDSDGKDMTVYEYSDGQVARRNSDKAKRVQKLRGLRKGLVSQVKKDFKSKDLQTKLTALAVALIDSTYERVGNEGSAKEGHFGVTGWQAQHVKFSGNKATITYVGKSGVKQTKTVNDAGAVKLLREITKGKSGSDSIFACEGDDGSEVCVTAKEVNEYLPKGITAKDLRGLHANQEMLNRLKAVRSKGPTLPSDRKAKDKILKAEFTKALEGTAGAVGHEPSTLKSQYLVPKLEDEFMKDGTVLSSLDGKTATKTHAEKEEEQTRKMLRKEPKKKPPRQDLRTHRLKDDEDVEEKPNADNDKDLSRNYKKIGQRVAALYLAKEVARSEQAAKKLFDKYKEKSPDTEKNWQDFYEKPEDKARSDEDPTGKPKGEGEKPKGKKPPKGEGAAPGGAKLDERAQALAHKKLVKDTMGEVKETLSKVEGVSLPGPLRKALTSALADMTPEQLQAFSKSLGEHSETTKTMRMDGPGAIKNAERALEDLKDYDFGGALNPAELAQKVVEQAHAETVLKRNKAKQTGKKRLISDTIDEIESKVKELAGEKYLLPKEVKTTLSEQMTDLDDEQIAGFAHALATGLEERSSEDMDSRDALDDARETVAESEDAIAENDNPDATAGAVADLIHARRVLDRSEGREKAKTRAEKAAVTSTARVFGGSEVPSEVKSKLEDALHKIPADKIPAYLDALKAEAERIQDALKADPETGEQEISPGLISEALSAMRSPEFSGTPVEVGQQVAMAMAGQSLISDPFDLAGEKVGAKNLDAAGQQRRGRQAFDKYKNLPAEMQMAAAKQIATRMESLDVDSSEAAELARILDGITLAAVVGERGDKDKIPQIPGREVNAGFAEMARAMAQDGKIDLLLGPVENFYSAEGQQAVSSAMQGMSDDALAASVKSIMPDAEQYLVGEKDPETGEMKATLNEASKSLLRNTLIDISIDQMTVMDRVLKSRLEESGDERFDDPEYREERMRTVRKSMGTGWWEKLLAKWFKTDSQNTQQPTPDLGAKSAGLLSVWKFGNFEAAKSDKLDPATGMRLEMLQALNDGLGKEVGKPGQSHSERALKLFMETKNPEFLRSNPETPDEKSPESASGETETAQGKKEGRFSRFSLDIGHVYTAGQPSVCAESPLSAPREEPK